MPANQEFRRATFNAKLAGEMPILDRIERAKTRIRAFRPILRNLLTIGGTIVPGLIDADGIPMHSIGGNQVLPEDQRIAVNQGQFGLPNSNMAIALYYTIRPQAYTDVHVYESTSDGYDIALSISTTRRKPTNLNAAVKLTIESMEAMLKDCGFSGNAGDFKQALGAKNTTNIPSFKNPKLFAIAFLLATLEDIDPSITRSLKRTVAMRVPEGMEKYGFPGKTEDTPV